MKLCLAAAVFALLLVSASGQALPHAAGAVTIILPVDAVVALDATGSMGASPCNSAQDNAGCPILEAKNAASNFAQDLLAEGNAQVGSTPFRGCFKPSGTNTNCVGAGAPGALSADSAAVLASVSGIDAIGGTGTNVCGGLDKANEILQGVNAHPAASAVQAVVLLTDGDNTYNNASYVSGSPGSPVAACRPTTSPANSDSYVSVGCSAPGTGSTSGSNPGSTSGARERELDVATLARAAALKASGVEIFVIGFGVCGTEDGIASDVTYCNAVGNADPDTIADQRLAKCIASSTPGTNDHYQQMDVVEGLTPAFASIADVLACESGADPNNGACAAPPAGGPVGTIATVAGGGTGGVGSLALDAAIAARDMDLGPDGTIYVANIQCPVQAIVNGRLAPVGDTGTCAPDEDPPNAGFGAIMGMGVDSFGNVYATDWVDCRVWRIDAVSGAATVVAGRTDDQPCDGPADDNVPATSTRLPSPSDVAVDGDGVIYIADGACRVRRVVGGVIDTVAGIQGPEGGGCPEDSTDGAATATHIGDVTSIAIGPDNSVYIAAGCRIRRLDAGTLTTIEGSSCGWGLDGPATGPNSGDAYALTVGPRGEVYFSDNHCRVQRVERGLITTIAGHPAGDICGNSGDGGPSRQAKLRTVTGLGMDAVGNLYFTELGDDYATSDVRVVYGAANLIAGPAGYVDTYAGPGGIVPMDPAIVPFHLAFDPEGNLGVGELGCTIDAVRDGTVVKIAGTDSHDSSDCGYAGDGGPAIDATISFRPSIAYDTGGNMYMTDWGNCVIRRVDAVSAIISTITGDSTDCYAVGDQPAPAMSAHFASPTALAISPDGDLLIAEFDGCRVRRLHAGQVTTVAGIRDGTICTNTGDGGPATSARIAEIVGMAVDAQGNIYLSTWGCVVRKISGGIITTIAGTGTCGYNGDGPATKRMLSDPSDLAVDAQGRVFIADSTNCRVRMLRDEFLFTIAGGGVTQQSWFGCGPQSLIENPAGIAIDSAGNVYFSELNGETGETRIAVIYGAAVDTDGDGMTDAEEGTDPIAYTFCRAARADVIPDTVINSGDQGKVASKVLTGPGAYREDQNLDGVVNSGDQGLVSSVIFHRTSECRG